MGRQWPDWSPFLLVVSRSNEAAAFLSSQVVLHVAAVFAIMVL